MHFRTRLRGGGTTEIIAFGPADAEATAEKELHRALPAAVLDIRAIRRNDASPRIVESFTLDYRLTLTLDVDSDTEKSARRAALVAARSALAGTRFERVKWER